ncbi:N-acetyltransferase [Halobacteriales archaeon QS_8_69_26]|nr:MAG: N-acetyltransferase [Halobacteriales archaeon QS_8_69_26]
MAEDLRIRRYESGDADAVWELHERAMRDAGTDPADLPGTDDLRRVREAYVETGGDFVVGVLEGEGDPAETDGDPLQVGDGTLVAMGGFLPCEEGHAEERSVEGAAELHRMRVAPDHQRKGYGRRILAALERRAREAGYELLLATTASRQRSAVRFYPDEGYVETGRSTHGEYELIHFEKRL